MAAFKGGKKRWKAGDWLLLVLVVGVGMSAVLVGCQTPTPTPLPTPPPLPPTSPSPTPPPPTPTPIPIQPPAEPPPTQPPSNPVPPNPCPAVYVTPSDDFANVRSGPTTVVNNLIGKLPGGVHAEPIGQFGREENGIWWWRVRYSDQGQTTEGWVRSDVVTLVGQVQFPRPKAWISPFGPGVGYDVTWEYGALADDGTPHNGVDLRSDNEPCREVFAMADGVPRAFPSDSNGYSVDVLHEHPDGRIYWVQYTHIKSEATNLRLGGFIEQNTRIGYYAQVGKSTGPHLHISIKNTDFKDPDVLMGGDD